MPMQHIENMMRRYRGQTVNIKTLSGGVYEGTVSEITSDYVGLVIKSEDSEREQVCVMFHSIESVLPRGVK
jgi:hypothetical protein